MENRRENINVFLHTISLGNIEENFAAQVENVELFKLQLNEYSQRALLLADKDDYIVLNSCPEQGYLDYLMGMGIGTSNILVPKDGNGLLSNKILGDDKLLNILKGLKKENERVILQPYISTEIEWEISEKINAIVNGAAPEVTKEINKKSYLRGLLQELNIPLTECVMANYESVVQIAEELRKKHTKIVVKGDISYGGSAVWKISNDDDFKIFHSQILTRKNNDQYLVEKMYDIDVSPNVQYEITTGRIGELAITDQILDDKLNHHGNVFPPKTKGLKTIREYSKKICERLQQFGYIGSLGIDFIVTADGEVFPVEMNGRANTSTFAVKVIQKMFPKSHTKKHFRSINDLKTEESTTYSELEGLIGKQNLFNKNTGSGIFPYNVGCLRWGKFDAIVISDTYEDVQRLLNHLYKKLKVD